MKQSTLFLSLLVGVVLMCAGLTEADTSSTFAFHPVEIEKIGVLWPCLDASLVTVDPDRGHVAPGALEFAPQAGLDWLALPFKPSIEAGHTYLVEAFVTSSGEGVLPKVGLRWHDSAGALLGDTYASPARGRLEWARLQRLFVAPEQAASAEVLLAVEGSEQAASPVWFDDVSCLRSPQVLVSSSRKGNVFFAPKPIKAEITLSDLPTYTYGLKFAWDWVGVDGTVYDSGERPFVEYSDQREVNFRYTPPTVGQFTLRWHIYGYGVPGLFGSTGYARLPRPDRRPYFGQAPFNVNGDLAGLPDEDAVSNACYVMRLPGVGWLRDSLHLDKLAGEGAANYVQRQQADLETQRVAGLQVLKHLVGLPKSETPSSASGDASSLDRPAVEKALQLVQQKFGTEVEAWQLWDAGAMESAGITPEEYLTLTRLALHYLKGAGDALLVSCSLGEASAGYVDALAAGGLAKYVDVLGLEYSGAPAGVAAAVSALRQRLGTPALDKPVWITRWYRTPLPDAAGDYASGEQLQARELVQTACLALTAGVKQLFFDCWDTPAGFDLPSRGLLGNNLTPRPAYGALSALNEYLGEAKYLGQLPAPEAAHAVVVNSSRGLALAAWGPEGSTLALGNAAGCQVLDMTGNSLKDRLQGETLTLQEAPVYVINLPGTIKQKLVKVPAD